MTKDKTPPFVAAPGFTLAQVEPAKAVDKDTTLADHLLEPLKGQPLVHSDPGTKLSPPWLGPNLKAITQSQIQILSPEVTKEGFKGLSSAITSLGYSITQAQAALYGQASSNWSKYSPTLTYNDLLGSMSDQAPSVPVAKPKISVPEPKPGKNLVIRGVDCGSVSGTATIYRRYSDCEDAEAPESSAYVRYPDGTWVRHWVLGSFHDQHFIRSQIASWLDSAVDVGLLATDEDLDEWSTWEPEDRPKPFGEPTLGVLGVKVTIAQMVEAVGHQEAAHTP